MYVEPVSLARMISQDVALISVSCRLPAKVRSSCTASRRACAPDSKNSVRFASCKWITETRKPVSARSTSITCNRSAAVERKTALKGDFDSCEYTLPHPTGGHGWLNDS